MIFSHHMGERSDAYRRRADDCDDAAARVRDPEVRSVYLAIGACWKKMGGEQLTIEAVHLGGYLSRKA
jgi:hypothetical protein